MTVGVSVPGGPRVRLAALAEAVIAHLPGVALTADTRWMTVDGDRRIPGVIAVAQPGGRYELTLQLVVTWPAQPLAELSEQLRRELHRAAQRDGLGDQLGDIELRVVALEDPA